MKKVTLFLVAALVGSTLAAQNDEVTVKRGKATMTEAYYYQLKQKADAYERLTNELESTTKRLEDTEKEMKRQAPKPIKTFNDSASYAIARDLANSWQQQQLGINLEIVAQSLQDLSHGRNNWNNTVIQSLLRRFQSQFEQRERKKHEEMMASKDKNKAEGAKFMKEISNNKSVYTTPSGLKYKVVKRGSGKKPSKNSVVKVNYTGTFIDGTKFDSSYDRNQPAEFPVNQVIPGWTEGLQLMEVGSTYIFYIPSELGYGDQLRGNIPPGSTLIFEVELLDIVK